MEKTVIGVDVGGTSIKIGAVSGREVFGKTSFPTPGSDVEKIADEIAHTINKLAVQTGAELVGIGMPGIIDSEKGRVVYSNNIAVTDVPLCEMIKARTGFASYMINDANAAALAEWKFGAGSGTQNLVMFTLGTGVGCGSVINGMPPASGQTYLAAGGHIIVREGGRKCTCGSRGCLEAYASATALIADTKTRLKKQTSLLTGKELNAKVIFEAEEAGDKVAKAAVSKYISYLAAGIASVYNLLFPEVFVLGGGVSNAGKKFIDRVTQEVRTKIYSKQDADKIIIRHAEMGNDAGIVGAAVYAKMREKQ